MWKIEHATDSADGTTNICRMAFHDTEDGRVHIHQYQLQTAIRIPPPGPGRGPAIAAFRKMLKALRTQAPSTDRTAIESALNAGGE